MTVVPMLCEIESSVAQSAFLCKSSHAIVDRSQLGIFRVGIKLGCSRATPVNNDMTCFAYKGTVRGSDEVHSLPHPTSAQDCQSCGV